MRNVSFYSKDVLTVEDIIKQVTDICKRNHVEHLSLFGSYAKGTEL